MTEKESAYIDYEAFLSPSFSPYAFANSIILATNNSTDVPLDLSTPLSKVLFDTQEIDTNIDALASKFALPLLTYTQEQTSSSAKIAQILDSQIASLNDSYKRLEKEVIVRHETAENTKIIAERLLETAKLGRSVVRCLQWGRQVEIQLAEIAGTGYPACEKGSKEDHTALIRCSNTLLSLHGLFSSKEEGEEGNRLEEVGIVKTLRNSIVSPAEKLVISKSQQIVREFSISSSSSAAFIQTGEVKARTSSALTSLYLLSLIFSTRENEKWEPEYLINALQGYLHNILNSSLASLSRALTTLPTLDRTLSEISEQCQNIVAIESILSEIAVPHHQSIPHTLTLTQNLLQPLLIRLETDSLISWFWRTLAGGLSTKMAELVNKNSISLRALRSNKTSVKNAIRECVVRGVQIPGKTDANVEGKWEREIAVMIGSISGSLGKGI